MDVEIGSVRLTELRDYCSRTFRHVAEGKGLEFRVDLGQNLPAEMILTDAKRLQQVLKNLLSNAIKFTEHGAVSLTLDRATTGWSANHAGLNRAKSVIAFTVTDTGIGIPQEKQRIVFEAFQQADGTTSRRYGGTGLGLSISRELARLLGGEIRLQSTPSLGSTFTLYLPQTYAPPATALRVESQRPSVISELPAAATEGNGVAFSTPSAATSAAIEDLVIEDDRNVIQPGDPVLLIVEDDITFARILVELARERGLKTLVALRGGTALSLAREFLPSAITLDIALPDMAGWTILDRLKHDPATRHIPIHVISGDENRRRGLALGAMTYLEKSITKDRLIQAFGTIQHSLQRRIKKLLVVTPDEVRRANLREVLEGPDLELLDVGSAGEALAVIKQQYLDAVVIDMRLNDIPALQLVEEVQSEIRPETPPVIVYSKRALSSEEQKELQRLATTSVVQHAQCPERLLDETVLLLHRAEADLSDRQREMLDQVRRSEASLVGKRVLVVDDDVRNIFALSSVLEQHNLHVLHADNGRAAIEVLEKTLGVDAVLMDIMMPGMDGYETTRSIRQMPPFRSLPIIAVTAKAMKGDRDKCIQAGASDYITKPVDLEQLFSVLRVWIVRGHDIPTDPSALEESTATSL
jgi:CheY-like chemotaxis protein/two-component sensor histidine kinase